MAFVNPFVKGSAIYKKVQKAVKPKVKKKKKPAPYVSPIIKSTAIYKKTQKLVAPPKPEPTPSYPDEGEPGFVGPPALKPEAKPTEPSDKLKGFEYYKDPQGQPQYRNYPISVYKTITRDGSKYQIVELKSTGMLEKHHYTVYKNNVPLGWAASTDPGSWEQSILIRFGTPSEQISATKQREEQRRDIELSSIPTSFIPGVTEKFVSREPSMPVELAKIIKEGKGRGAMMQPTYTYTTATPEQLQIAPSWESRVETSGERATRRAHEMRHERGHFIGRDPDTKEGIYIHESPYQIKHEFPLHDPDYKSAFTDITGQRELIETGLENIGLAKTSLPIAQENYDMVYGSPAGSKFKVDLDNDGAWDVDPSNLDEFVYKTREELLPMLKTNISDLKKNIGYETELEKSLSQLSNTESILRGRQRLGYQMDITDEGYSFKLPTAIEVHEWRYGETGPTQLTAAAFMKSPLAIGTFISALTGDEGEKERLAEYSLGLTSTLKHKGLGAYAMETYVGSPAMVEGVYVPLATIGLGYGFTGMGAGLKQVGGRFIAKVGEKLPTIFTGTGGKIISTTMKVTTKVLKPIASAGSVFGRVLGTKAGNILFTGSLYGVMEGPGLLETYKEDPSRLPGKVGTSLFSWGMAIGGFKYGQKLWTATHLPTKIPTSEKVWGPEKDWTMRFETQQTIMGKQPITMKKISADLKDYTKFEWWSKHGQQYVTDIRGPGDIITRGPYSVDVYGKALVAKHDISTMIVGKFGPELKIIPKGTVFSFGTGIIRDPITGKLVQKSASHVFKTVGTGGPLTVAVTGPQATIPNAFWGKGTTRLLSTGEVVKVTGTGLLSTSKPGHVILSKWGQTKDVIKITSKAKGVKIFLKGKEIDFSKTISKVYSADTSKYMFYGKYKPTGFDIGEIYQTGPLAIITEAKPIGQIVTTQVGTKSLLHSEQAMASLVKPVQPTTITKILSAKKAVGEIVGGIGEAVGALPPVITPAPPTVLTMMAKPGTGFPSAVAGITRLGAEEELLVAKPVSVLETKPVSIAEITAPGIMGGLQIIEPVAKKEEKIDYRRIYRGGLKVEGELGEELTAGGLITEPGVGIGEREAEDVDVGVFTEVDVGTDLWQGQQQRLGLKSLLELKTVGAIDLITVTPTVVTPTPITLHPPHIPRLFPGDKEPLMIRKKKKKPKKRVKRKDEPRIAERAFLADLISVTGTQARYKGKATHLPLTEEMWELAEETGFTRVPTVELLEERRGKRKKKKLPKLI